MTQLIKAMARHGKIALQVSGGRDSLACLYLMKKYWDLLTVYWLNTGDAFPETIEVMKKVREMVPNFIEIDGGQPAVIREFGIPTDILPVASTPIGIMGAGGKGILMQDRYSCCWKSLMEPLHRRMLADGITLIVRGQRDSDELKAPVRTGSVIEGIEYLHPIEAWSADQVDEFLTKSGVEMPRFYESMSMTPDCMTCSAWWNENRSQYLKRYYPEKHRLYQDRLDAIRIVIHESIKNFNVEVEN